MDAIVRPDHTGPAIHTAGYNPVRNFDPVGSNIFTKL